MIGVSGTSGTGASHQYYYCATKRRRKGKCNKKTVRKAYIEDEVVMNVRKILTPETIENISRTVAAKSEKERNTDELKRINKLLRENEKATANLIKALEAGKAAEIISTQIEKRQAEKADLEIQLAKERLQRPQLEYNNVKFFFERFAKGDPNNIDYRRSLVDVFIGSITLANNNMEIFLNVQEGQKMSIPLGEHKSSPKGRLVETIGVFFYPFLAVSNHSKTCQKPLFHAVLR